MCSACVRVCAVERTGAFRERAMQAAATTASDLASLKGELAQLQAQVAQQSGLADVSCAQSASSDFDRAADVRQQIEAVSNVQARSISHVMVKGCAIAGQCYSTLRCPSRQPLVHAGCACQLDLRCTLL
jgi:excinuclease UvrABC nuclease subunit